MTPNAVKALRCLEVEHAVLARAFAPKAQVARSWRSGRAIDVAPLDTHRDHFGAGFFTTHRGDLQEVLRASVGDEHIELRKRCVAVSSDATRARARFEDGSEIEADVLVGADGIHSVVRADLFGADTPRFTGNVCWRGLVDTTRLPPGLAPADFTLWWGPHGHVVHYYVRRGELLNWVAITETDAWSEESWSTEGDLDEVKRTYAGWNAQLLALFDATERCYKWALYDRDPLPRWTTGRVTLLGDAAHPMLPYLAQGAAQALEDGYVLADMLAQHRGDATAALMAYERARLPRTARIQLQARARGKINNTTSAFQRFTRDLGYRIKRLIKPKEHTYKIEWIYGHDVTAPPGVASEAA